MSWGPLKWYHLADIACMCFYESNNVQTALKEVLHEMELEDREKLIDLLNKGGDDLLEVFRKTAAKVSSKHAWEATKFELKVRKGKKEGDPEKAMVISPDGIYLFWPLPIFDRFKINKDDIKEDKSPDLEEDLDAAPFYLMVDNELLVPAGTESNDPQVKATMAKIRVNLTNSFSITNSLKLFAMQKKMNLPIPSKMKFRANEDLELHESNFSAKGDTLKFEMGLKKSDVFKITATQWPCCNLDPC